MFLFWGETQIALEHRASFFYYEKLGELLRSAQTLSFWSQHSLLYFSFLCLLKANCNFQKRGLKDCVQHSFTVAEVDSKTIFCTILKRLIGSVPIREGPGDVAQSRGWNPLSTFVCDSLILCFFYICLSVLFSISALSIYFPLILFH